eukprot:gnl/TRDRNA2_/TRDRNA2_39433_c0_seq1.p1 gnl/TRDRNA2_/TRDRNA2_39433_c0~~gnl/TRDRNA2_/TRDRNA2_39433_c0_seq1.p1  ORF type:complete len:470 (+),score=192.97 gnl/TRDRNA2_/TRDRNA2_39433_c0_seq1:128-1411(+)
MDEEKTGKANAAEVQSTAEGDLSVASKSLDQATGVLKDTQQACMTSADDHEKATVARAEELKVLAEVKKIIVEATSLLQKQTETSDDSSESFLQVSSTHRQRSNNIVTLLKNLAKKQHSAALMQLAGRVSAVVRYGKASNSDPFAKIKEMLTGMIAKIQKEMEADAGEKQFCDEEMKKTEAKKSELEEDNEALTAKIDKASSATTELKESVMTMQGELALLSKQQSEMDKARADEHETYLAEKADLEKGLAGLRKALDVLRDYYGAASFLQQEQPAAPAGHEKSSGAGQGIIQMIEVAESDMAKELEKVETAEADAQDEYDKITQENKMTKATKMQDVKYKSAEAKGLDKTIAELSGDRDTVQSELSAVEDYYAKIKDRCVAKAPSYEERKKRRDAEIAGLKEGLEVLENEAAFIQHPNFRGAMRQL